MLVSLSLSRGVRRKASGPCRNYIICFPRLHLPGFYSTLQHPLSVFWSWPCFMLQGGHRSHKTDIHSSCHHQTFRYASASIQWFLLRECSPEIYQWSVLLGGTIYSLLCFQETLMVEMSYFDTFITSFTPPPLVRFLSLNVKHAYASHFKNWQNKPTARLNGPWPSILLPFLWKQLYVYVCNKCSQCTLVEFSISLAISSPSTVSDNNS